MTKDNKTTIPANDIYSAIFNVQQEVSTKIKANASNQFFSKNNKKTYADLYAIMEVLTPALGTNKILLMQSISTDCIETTIYHIDSGQSIVKEHKIDMSRLDAQQIGSYTTYMRRYSICALFGIAVDKEDDNGKAAVGATNNKFSVVKGTNNLSDEEMSSKEFKEHIDRCINKDGMTPKEVLDKIKAKYILTPSQEATILNLK